MGKTTEGLNRKIPVTMGTGDAQNCQKSLFCIVFFSIKTDFKVLQLLNELR
jgi:hypothetical protein